MKLKLSSGYDQVKSEPDGSKPAPRRWCCRNPMTAGSPDRPHPMSPEAYRGVLEYTRRYGEYPGELEFLTEEWLLRQDMASGKVRWYGEWWKDFELYMCNNNPIFAMFFSHKLHPITRNERLFVYLTIICAKISFSFGATKAAKCIEQDIMDCDKQFHIARYHPHQDVEFCCECYKFGIILFLRVMGVSIGAKVYTVLMGIIYAITMFLLVACPWAQKLESSNRHLAEYAGYAVVGVITVLLCGLVFGHVVQYCWIHGLMGNAIFTFLTAQATSWTFTILLVPGMLAFALLNFLQRRAEPQDELDVAANPDDRRWNVTWKEYQEWLAACQKENELGELPVEAKITVSPPGDDCHAGSVPATAGTHNAEAEEKLMSTSLLARQESGGRIALTDSGHLSSIARVNSLRSSNGRMDSKSLPGKPKKNAAMYGGMAGCCTM